MKILIAAAGSHGDVLPFVGLGRALQQRGHAVTLWASGVFAGLAAEAGLGFTEAMTSAEYQRILANPDATHPRRGMALIAQLVADTQRRCLAQLAQAVEPGRTLIIGSSLAFATRILSERHRMPVVTVHLAPSLLRSNHQAPAFGALGHLERAPRLLKRLLWRTLDTGFLDPLFTAPFNTLRAEQGLPPVKRLFHRWLHAGDLTLALFPAWFAPPQPDAPDGVQWAGFPLYDHHNGAPLPPALADFLETGEAPVAFTAGTANVSSHAFFQASIEACQRAGCRGLMITQDASQLPTVLPEGIISVGYVPFSALLPRVSALVHHGGIGTTSQALRAGVPQLVRPMAFDQFDNACRVQTLGVGRTLHPRQYRPARVAQMLHRLRQDPAVQARCAAVAQRLAQEGSGLERAADAVLALAAQRGL